MSTKHTQGPWLRDTTSGISCDVRAENGRKVALCWGLSTSNAARNNTPAYRAECDANARLIAAAPELLEALKDAVQQLAFLKSIGVQSSTIDREIRKSRAAIAKATGEKQ